MELFKLLLIIHIIFGSLSLIFGTLILFLRKGDKKHQFLGRFFFYSLLTASVVSIILCYLHTNYFLFLIAIFTLYMLLTGQRYISKAKPYKANAIDWIITSVMIIFSFLFIFFGIKTLISGNTFGIVFCVFGSIGIFLTYGDWKNYTGKPKISNFYLTGHLQRMIGSYIASLTAFIVVNNKILPPVVAWLLPTVVLVPLIIVWTKKHKNN